MIDFNNLEELEKLKRIAQSQNGKVIVEFIASQLDGSLSFENINKDQSPDKVALDYMSIRNAREFIIKLIRLLTPEKGD
jgi:hypothetical protein